MKPQKNNAAIAACGSSLDARERSNVNFGSSNAELEGISLAQNPADLLGGNRVAIHRDAVLKGIRPHFRHEHDESVPGESAAECAARGVRGHRGNLLNWRLHSTHSSRDLEGISPEEAVNQPTTLATVKPPRNRRTRLRPDTEHKDCSHG